MRALIFIAAVSIAGCGWKSDGLERLEELYPTPKPVDAGTQTGTIDIGIPKCHGFAGTWAVRMVQTGTIAPLGEPWKITINDLFLADATDDSMELTFCDQTNQIVTSSGATDLGRSIVQAPARAALAKTPVLLNMPGDGSFSAEKIVWLWGVRNLMSPATDPLPTKENFMGDARVFDQDEDGLPGVSLSIVSPAGERYMARRAVWSLAKGKLSLDNQWITGALTSEISESPLGASNNLLLTVAPITINAPGTVYQLRCVGSSYTCTSFAKDHARLFKDAPK